MGFSASVMIDGIDRHSQNKLLLHFPGVWGDTCRVMPISHIIGCLKRSDRDDTLAFLKSLDVFNWNCSEQPHKKRQRALKKDAGCSSFSLGHHVLPHVLCSHWEQLKKTIALSKKKKKLCGQTLKRNKRKRRPAVKILRSKDIAITH